MNSPPSFGSPDPLGGFAPMYRLLQRSRGLAVACGVLALAVFTLFVVSAVRDRPVLPAREYRIGLIGDDPSVLVLADPVRGQVDVRGAVVGPDRFLVGDGQLLVLRAEIDGSGVDGWYSVPARDVLASPVLFDAARLISILDRDVKECTLPTEEADALVSVMVIQHFDPSVDPMRYNICGGGVFGGSFADGYSVRVDVAEVHAGNVDWPAAADITNVTDLDERAEEVTARIAELFDHPE